MEIRLVCVGNLKEKYFVDAMQEYLKRLQRFASIEVIEVKEEKLNKNYSQADIEFVKEQETNRILKQLKGFVVLCDLSGKTFTSEEFAKQIKKVENNFSTITFVIGGSYGVSNNLKQNANLLLKFSDFVFPHQLFRVMLAEQIYRAYTIINNITYHK